MFKKKISRKQQLKFMFFNLLAFTLIFAIFGVIIFTAVQNTLFSKPDVELLAFKDKMLEHREADALPKKGEPGFRNGHEKLLREKFNPRIIVLSWNQAGEIVNENEIGTSLFENYLQDFQLDTANLNKINSIEINDSYHFRSILFKDPNEDDAIAYTQLMMNIDAEHAIMDNFEKLIILYSVIFILLSITASFILSKKMMRPIIHSWKKQAEFVENASHELRTPLTIIQNKLELLLTQPEEKIKNKFENIALSLSETRRLTKLTSDLLTLARADSDETQLVLQSIPVDPFVEKVCAPYIEIAESQEKQFWLNLNCDAFVEADEVRLHQLLVILLDNALKYTGEHDSIGVKTYIEDHKAVLEVSDTGIGIKEENIDHVFERFYREDKARSRETGGVGLGLSIAQWIISEHGGTIKVRRNQPKGTTFIVRLPI